VTFQFPQIEYVVVKEDQLQRSISILTAGRIVAEGGAAVKVNLRDPDLIEQYENIFSRPEFA
jgi:hypothetical protein